MRIVCFIVAFSGLNATALAFSRSKVEHSFHYESRRRQRVVVAGLQPLIRSTDASTGNKSLLSTIDLKTLEDKNDTKKRPSIGKVPVDFRAIFTAIALAATITGPAFADEYGVEKEAPTLFTGETVEVCTNASTWKPRCLIFLIFSDPLNLYL